MKADLPKEQRRIGKYGLKPEDLRDGDPILANYNKLRAEEAAISRAKTANALTGLADLRRRGLV